MIRRGPQPAPIGGHIFKWRRRRWLAREIALLWANRKVRGTIDVQRVPHDHGETELVIFGANQLVEMLDELADVTPMSYLDYP